MISSILAIFLTLTVFLTLTILALASGLGSGNTHCEQHSENHGIAHVEDFKTGKSGLQKNEVL